MDPRRLLAALVIALGVLALSASPATAACTTRSYFLADGTTQVCTTCCHFGVCSTTCT